MQKQNSSKLFMLKQRVASVSAGKKLAPINAESLRNKDLLMGGVMTPNGDLAEPQFLKTDS